MKTHEEKVAAAQEVLHAAIQKLIDKHGVEVALEALAVQFGISGAAATICGVISPAMFVGRYTFRAIAVCDSACKKHYIEGVIS